MCVSAFFCVVLSCVGIGLALDRSPPARSPTKCLMDPRNWNRSLGWQGTVEALFSMQSKRGINDDDDVFMAWYLVKHMDNFTFLPYVFFITAGKTIHSSWNISLTLHCTIWFSMSCTYSNMNFIYFVHRKTR